MRLPVPLMQLLLGAGFLAAWQAASTLGWVDRELLPAFSTVLAAAARLLTDQDFLADAGDTALRVAAAFLIGAPLAISFGLFAAERLRLERIVSPISHFVMAIPQSIFLPIFIFLFGIGFGEKVIYGITHVFFVVTVTSIAAVKQVPSAYLLAARSFGLSNTDIYRRIYLPAMAPVIVTGLRLGLIFDIIGVLLAEMYASQNGLGVLIFRWGEAADTKRTMAAILLISCATILANEAMRLWEVRVGRWKVEMDRHG
jgi:NitT/TauT family transport system permease protein